MSKTFVYNKICLHIQKAVQGVFTNYTLHGKNIVHMTCGSDNLHFFYDAHGKPAIVVYNGVPYSYVKNLQGDIVAILDSTGAVVVSYVYDAWGKPISTTGTMAATLGEINPFRYRSYTFDCETGLYYLRSRYYTIKFNRFVNADALYEQNLFTYCQNNPIVNADSSGFACMTCFDENGFETPFITMAMYGGVGNSADVVLFEHKSADPRAFAHHIYKYYTKISYETDSPKAACVEIYFEKWLKTHHYNEWSMAVSDWLAYFIAEDISAYHGIDNNIDKTQLSAEIEVHYWLDIPFRILKGDTAETSTDIFNLDIFMDGSVIDPNGGGRQLVFNFYNMITPFYFAE